MKKLNVLRDGKVVATTTLSEAAAKAFFKGCTFTVATPVAPPVAEKKGASNKMVFLDNLVVPAVSYQDNKVQVISKAMSLHILDMLRYAKVADNGRLTHVPMKSTTAKDQGLVAERLVYDGNWYTMQQEELDKVYTKEVLDAQVSQGLRTTNRQPKVEDVLVLMKAYLLSVHL